MIHMVPRDYWTNDRIIRHAARLLKQPMSDEDDTKDVNGASIFSDPPSSDDDNTDDAFELNTTEALKPAEYNKVDLEEAHQQRRQSKVTQMLEAERRLVRGKTRRVERTSSFN